MSPRFARGRRTGHALVKIKKKKKITLKKCMSLLSHFVKKYKN
ncbi:MAG TPA: hypothetical protein PLL08_00165 [Bacteroidales bacterium]|nr:hypothetical protein [Bacteroidales bacterium]HRR03892.1 hypothetical protein [Bacteroidales bacterium]HXK73312.1 hypothetical protein [Bacteroidales bacterium]